MTQLPHVLIPSKTFLFGEYAVLENAPGIILATPPFFELQSGSSPAWHPESIANRMLGDLEQKFALSTVQDFKGLGKSGAECIASWLHSAKEPNINDLITCYKEALQHHASAADIKCMWLGNCTDFLTETSTEWPFINVDIGIWSTGIKIATHEHLATKPTICQAIKATAIECYKAWKLKDLASLVNLINKYQKTLSDSGLQINESQIMVSKIMKNNHVLACKASGALGGDIILTLSNKDCRNKIIEYVADLGLSKIFLGNYVVPGVYSQWEQMQQSISYKVKLYGKCN